MSSWKKALSKVERSIEKRWSPVVTPTGSRREAERKILKSFPNGSWETGWTPGVLLADQICRAVEEFQLIVPFERLLHGKGKLRPAGYELSVGEVYSKNGKTLRLRDEQNENEIIVEPFEVVVIQTRERLNIPEFMIARWNVTVGRTYQGFLWVGAAQVDPGFKGFLCCPIYNLSDKRRSLRYGEPLAVIDFVVTTPPNNTSRDFTVDFTERKRVIFEDYEPNGLKSALVNARDRIEHFEASVGELRNTVFNSIGIILAAIGAVVTALALFVGGKPDQAAVMTQLSAPLLLSSGAFTLSLCALVFSVTKSKNARLVWSSLFVFATLFFVFWYASHRIQSGIGQNPAAGKAAPTVIHQR